MPISIDDFKMAAHQAYTALKPAFDAEATVFFWRLGHSFDTIVDYFLSTDGSDANNFAAIAIKKYNDGGGAWYDDFGWWGISGLKASTARVFGGNDVVFRSMALACWDKMATNAPYGWQRADQKKFADFAPLFDGGVWNHIVDDGCHPGGADQLCGRQNTVTNASYLVLAERLSLDKNVPPNPAYGAAARQEHQFLNNWFYLAQKPADLALMNNYAAGRAVVRERVGTFRSGVTDPGYRKDLAWAGDQGLILGGLVDRMRIVTRGSPEYPVLLGTARKLLAGTREYLTAQKAEPGILQPWWPGGAPGDDDDDYWTGPAVYMRYLLDAFRNDDLKTDLLAPTYQAFIRANAEYVVNNPGRPQSGDTVVNLTNNLAILVAAIVMLATDA